MEPRSNFGPQYFGPRAPKTHTMPKTHNVPKTYAEAERVEEPEPDESSTAIKMLRAGYLKREAARAEQRLAEVILFT